MRNFFDIPKRIYSSRDNVEKSLNEELHYLFKNAYSNHELQSLFNEYFQNNTHASKANLFITTLTQNLDKIQDGNLLYQAYKIIRSPKAPDNEPYLEILLRASLLGSFHAQHELAMIVLNQNTILMNEAWVSWALEHLRGALDNYYDLPNQLSDIKNLFRDLVRMNTFLQAVLENYNFYIDTMPIKTSPEYQHLTKRLLELQISYSRDYLINLPFPDSQQMTPSKEHVIDNVHFASL